MSWTAQTLGFHYCSPKIGYPAFHYIRRAKVAEGFCSSYDLPSFITNDEVSRASILFPLELQSELSGLTPPEMLFRTGKLGLCGESVWRNLSCYIWQTLKEFLIQTGGRVEIVCRFTIGKLYLRQTRMVGFRLSECLLRISLLLIVSWISFKKEMN